MNNASDDHDSEKGRIPVSHARKPSRIANPGPAGCFGFASTAFLLSLYNLNARGVHTPNVVVGMGVFAGGLVQLLAGMWEFPQGNLFGATVFSSFGAFWTSYATIFIPGPGILNAYQDQTELSNAIGLYLIVWFMVTVMFTIPVILRNLAFTVLLSTLAIAFLLLAIAEFTGMPSLAKAGGAFGIVTAVSAFYVGISGLLAAEETAFMRLPLGVR
ncbi:putative GPR1/FUN34/yaaH family protein [Lyophyllum shimeji]|uniref:GPR1/FUN34/yaaH family protein n=1 Tax=Lyophyllum shimeji TaxID=47721 RepID=A0A9P3PF83_LYOSH|nr:putative GPR1/FUN34/yaaH family protein [Lyophyllum shimeji]